MCWLYLPKLLTIVQSIGLQHLLMVCTSQSFCLTGAKIWQILITSKDFKASSWEQK
nr:MAG TPA: hypothetical protein [Caudoviricetes sp.]